MAGQICVVDVTVSESESIIVGDENQAYITLFCQLKTNATQTVTWLIADEGEGVAMARAINTSTPGFQLCDENTTVSSATNLTILVLTEDLDNKVIFCGVPGNEDALYFSLRIYRELTAPHAYTYVPEA